MSIALSCRLQLHQLCYIIATEDGIWNTKYDNESLPADIRCIKKKQASVVTEGNVLIIIYNVMYVMARGAIGKMEAGLDLCSVLSLIYVRLDAGELGWDDGWEALLRRER
jgi:hypothetical protein